MLSPGKKPGQGRMSFIMQDKLDGSLFMKAEAQDMLASPNEFMRKDLAQRQVI